ncbi:MAG: nucleotidyltransferase family protein, partial [Butyricicoccaceae bacterium]
LFPNPDSRMSSDEDMLIPPEQFALCHQAMLEYGMVLSDPEMDLDAAYEVPYGKRSSPIYIELHKSLFPPDSEAYGEFNRFFARVHETAIEIPVQGVSILSMDHTDHLFYLLCHSFKHFLHSGFGIRQVCDLVLYANEYGSRIDWLQILENCREIHAELFAAALFRVGAQYLTFDPKKACYPKEWSSISVDETAMLEDLLASGVYGNSNMSRKHSSNMTLSKVSAQKKGKKVGNHVLKTVFPSAKDMAGRYPYLKKLPFLLPVAWADRAFRYWKETRGNTGGNNAAESIQIGNQRIELMRQYGIIDRE